MAAVRPDTALVSVMMVNNELGHGAGVRDDGEQRAGQHLSHCRHRQGFEGRQ